MKNKLVHEVSATTARQDTPDVKRDKVSVIVPAHNEEEALELAVSKLQKAVNQGLDFELIIVDDNSNDGTPAIADQLASKYSSVRVVHRTEGPSFSGALKAGVRASEGEYLVIFMADLSDEPADILRLHSKIVGGYDVVIGSRFSPGSQLFGYPLTKFLANRLYNFSVRLLFNIHLKDTTNAFRVYRRWIFENIRLESESFDVNAEVLIKAKRRGARITELPVSWHARKGGESKMKLARAGIHYGKTMMRLFLRIWF